MVFFKIKSLARYCAKPAVILAKGDAATKSESWLAKPTGFWVIDLILGAAKLWALSKFKVTFTVLIRLCLFGGKIPSKYAWTEYIPGSFMVIQKSTYSWRRFAAASA